MTVPDKEVEKFEDAVKLDIATEKQGGKHTSTYSDTVKELKAAEEGVVKAVRIRDQLLANKRFIMAQVSEKALKVVKFAHASVVADVQNSKKRRVLDGSQPEEETTTTSSGGWSFFGGAAGGATGKK